MEFDSADYLARKVLDLTVFQTIPVSDCAITEQLTNMGTSERECNILAILLSYAYTVSTSTRRQ